MPTAKDKQKQSESTDIVQEFKKVYQAFTSKLAEIDGKPRQASGEAAQRATQRVEEARIAYRKLWSEHYESYLQQMEDALRQPEYREQALQTYQTYTDTMAAAENEYAENSKEIHQAYQKEIEQAREMAAKELDDLYQTYVGDFQTLWTNSDPAGLDTNAFASIGESMVSVAYLMDRARQMV